MLAVHRALASAARLALVTEVAGSDTKRALIDEAIAGLLELTPADLLSAVGLRAIAERAGVGVTTLYHHFGNLAGFAEAVTARVFEPAALPVEQITAFVQEIAEAPFPSVASRALHRAEIERLSGDPELRARMGLWALGGGTTDHTYREFLRATDAVIAHSAAVMLKGWGREPRPPFDIATYVAAHVALLNGASIRRIVDPEVLDPERYAVLASTLSLLVARAIDDPRTIEDRLTELDHHPVRQPKAHALTEARQRTRAEILAAASAVFAQQDHEPPTIARIAAAAGVGKSTVYAQFDDVDDVAVHALQAATHGASLAGAGSVAEAVEQLARALSRQAHLLPAYGARLVAGTVPQPDPLLTAMRTALQEGQHRGEVLRDAEVDDAALAIVTLLVQRLLVAAGAGPSAAAACAARLLLPAILA